MLAAWMALLGRLGTFGDPLGSARPAQGPLGLLGASEGVKTAQDGLQTRQEGPKTARDGPKRDQRAPKKAQEGPKRTPKTGSRGQNQ